MYFIIISAIINGTLNLNSNILLLIYSIDFNVLTLKLVTFLNSLISPMIVFFRLRGFFLLFVFYVDNRHLRKDRILFLLF